MSKFTAKILQPGADVPSLEQVSAVFLIAFNGEKILSIKNERGWDIPGGHMEPRETLIEGLHREVIEEGGADFITAVPYAILLADWTEKVMLFYITDSFQLGEFVPSEDVLDRNTLSEE